jgi:16S rRNA (adenine1518-N6/adenine1519-N6)-dimethyltransferase
MIHKNKITHSYKKQFGQHFLLNKKINEKIIGFSLKQIDLDSPDQAINVIEIGPGAGHLSEVILSEIKPRKLVMIEKDLDLEKILTQKFNLKEFPRILSEESSGEIKKIFENVILNQDNQEQRISLIFNDAMKINFEKLILDDLGFDPRKEKICLIANLPYNIATKLLLNFFEIQSRLNLFDLITVLIQKEVSERFVIDDQIKVVYEKPQILSGLLFAKSLKHFQIGPKNFTPPPKVDSTLISFVKNQNLDVNSFKFEEFMKFLNSAFGFPRKMLFNNLKNFYKDEDLLKMTFDACGIKISTRPSDLGPNKYLELFRFYKSKI